MRSTRVAMPVVASCVLAISAMPAQAALGNRSCAADFTTGFAPHSAGTFGETISTLTGVFEPNFGQGGVTFFARAPKDACP